MPRPPLDMTTWGTICLFRLVRRLYSVGAVLLLFVSLAVGSWQCFIFGMSVFCRSCFPCVGNRSVSCAPLGFAVPPDEILAAKFRAGSNVQYFLICNYLCTMLRAVVFMF